MVAYRLSFVGRSASPRLAPTLLTTALCAAFSVQAQSVEIEAALPEVQVRATGETPFKAERSSSPKLTQPLLDTPQTVSVIKRELIESQAATRVVDVLRNTPGITLQMGENGNTSAGDTFQLRGFAAQTSLFVDGVRDLGGITRDSFDLEQVEIVKGPAGADVGRGASSGYINLISKLPVVDTFRSTSVAAMSGNGLRATADLNQSLNATSAARLNVFAQTGDVPGRNEVRNRSVGIAPGFAVGLGTPTRFFLYSQHLRLDNVPDGGVPTIGLPGFYNADPALRAGARVDRANFYGNSADYEKIDADRVTAKVEHDFGNGAAFSNLTRYGASSIDRVLTGVNALSAPIASNPDTWTVARTRQRLDQENRIVANQSNLRWRMDTGAIRHDFTTGVEFMQERQDSPSFAVPASQTIAAANLYNPNVNTPLPTPQPNGAFANGKTDTVAVYAGDTLTFSPKWQLNGGLRFEHYKTETRSVALSTATSNPSLPVGTLVPSQLSKSDNLTSWKLGTVYKPQANASFYAAMANSLTPPGSANFALSPVAGNANDPSLDPQRSRSVEIGTKWDVLQNRLALTAALYRTDNTNEVTQLDPVTNTYAQFGKRRVEGVELGAIGQVTPAWQVFAGLATLDTEILQGTSGNSAAGAATRWSPDLTVNLWSTYKLSPKWTLGGGAYYVSEQQRVVDPSLNPTTQVMPNIPSYWVFNALAAYQATKNVSVQLNVNNLFDKFYISSLNNSGARYLPGAPRTAVLSANLQF